MQCNVLKCCALLFVFVLTNKVHGGDKRIRNEHGKRDKVSFYKKSTYNEQEIETLCHEAEMGCTLAMNALSLYHQNHILSGNQGRKKRCENSVFRQENSFLWNIRRDVMAVIQASIYEGKCDREGTKQAIEKLEKESKRVFYDYKRDKVVDIFKISMFKGKSYDKVRIEALRWVHLHIESGKMKFCDPNHSIDESRISGALKEEYKRLKLCVSCYKIPPTTHLWDVCGGCHSISYCSKLCQNVDWPTHKTLCKSLKKV